MVERVHIAAIPTWNMAEHAVRTAGTLLEQGFDRVVVLDDNSTDDTVEQIHDTYADAVEVVTFPENIGSAGNRNRIIRYMARIGVDATAVTFLDADMILRPSEIALAEVADRALREYPNAGIIGGQVLTQNGQWSGFNYGPQLSWRYFRSMPMQMKVDALAAEDEDAARALHDRHRDLLQGYPEAWMQPEPTQAGWVVENLVVVPAETLQRHHGYDARLRYLEAVDLGARVLRAGQEVQFDPSLAAQHLQIDVRGEKMRTQEIRRATARLALRLARGYYR